ncbi:MAG: hypothetical protein EBU21_15315, partial [Proteobacteria bacterium]|nr:hypothetical protein [Pseudomonadota bacterium]NBT04871.1 hypothetical protein [Pseudomonadota bacterium]
MPNQAVELGAQRILSDECQPEWDGYVARRGPVPSADDTGTWSGCAGVWPPPLPVATGEGWGKVLAADGTAGGEAVDLRGADGDDVGPDLA